MKAQETKTKAKEYERLLGLFEEVDKVEVKDLRSIEELLRIYQNLTEEQRLSFMKEIVLNYGIKKESLEPILREVLEKSDSDRDWQDLLINLRDATLSPRLKKLRSLIRWPGGLKFLLDLRGDVLNMAGRSDISLAPLERDISLLFEGWFQEGFLYLEEITLDSPYRQIEIIKNRDLVHPMTTIEEMGERLGKDRRCFALYHKVWPMEPIVFIEVALTEGVVRSIEEIVGKERRIAQRPDTAIFYSINNTQNGLAGLGLGKVLIFKVVEFITNKEPNIRNFATLSPLTGFYRAYLRPILAGKDTGFLLKRDNILEFFKASELKRLTRAFNRSEEDISDLPGILLETLDSHSWIQNEELVDSLEGPLRRIAYHYISNEKTKEGKPLNPVANFHLGNGATVSKRNVNFLANRSERALRDALGFMVNYIYSYSWLTEFSKAIRWLDRIEIRGLVSKWF